MALASRSGWRGQKSRRCRSAKSCRQSAAKHNALRSKHREAERARKMSSILTNNSAMVALQTMKSISSNLNKTQAEISTGKAVGSAKDNATVWMTLAFEA